MGLLDLADDPKMGLAMGLLSASGPSSRPVSMGQALGMGIQGMQQTREQGMQNQMRQMQMDAYKQAQEQAKKKQLMMAEFLKNPSIPENIRQAVASGAIDLGDLMKPQTIKEGESINIPMLSMMGQNGTIAQGPAKAPKMGTEAIFGPNNLWQTYQTVDGVPDLSKPIGSPFARGKDASTLNVNQPYEKEFDKKRAELDAKSLDEMRTKAQTGRTLLSTVNRLEQLNPAVYSGGGAGAKLAAANFLHGLGVNIGDAEKVAKSQEFDAIAKKAVLDSLGGSLGAGVSNTDVSFIERTLPQLSHSVEARKAMMQFMREKAMKQIKLYESALAFADEKGNLKGFKPERSVIREGRYNGRKVVEYDDGSVEYAN